MEAEESRVQDQSEYMVRLCLNKKKKKKKTDVHYPAISLKIPSLHSLTPREEHEGAVPTSPIPRPQDSGLFSVLKAAPEGETKQKRE
jgi:hypothetical protein